MSLWNVLEAFGVKQNEEVFGNTQNCFAHLFGIRTRPSRWKGVLSLYTAEFAKVKSVQIQVHEGKQKLLLPSL